MCLACSGVQAKQFKMVRVANWDNITILQKGQKARIRLVGIDTQDTTRSKRKLGQPYSQKSKKHLIGRVLNQQVAMKSYGRDRYGQVLGEVFLYGANVILETVAVGLAEVYRGRAGGQGDGYGKYWEVQTAARRNGLNICSMGHNYVSPSEWRRRS